MHSRTIAPSYPNAQLIPQGSFSELPPIALGRAMTLIGSGDAVHLRLRSSTISPVHAAVLNVGGRLILRDLGSHTHVYVNRIKVREAVLQDGDQIRIGRLLIAVQIGDVEPAASAPPPVPDAWLWNESGQALKILPPVHLIGSHPDSDLILDPKNSPVMAAIFTLESRRVLRNLGHADSVRVNGAAIQQAVLLEGDVIEIGELRVQFELERRPCSIASTGEPPAQEDARSDEDTFARPAHIPGNMPSSLGMPISIDQQSATSIPRHIELQGLPIAASALAEVRSRHSEAGHAPMNTISAELYERARSWGPLARALMAVPQIPVPSAVPVIEAAVVPVRSRRWAHLSLVAVAVLVAIGLGAWLHLRGTAL